MRNRLGHLGNLFLWTLIFQSHLRKVCHLSQPLHSNLTNLAICHPLLGQRCVGAVNLFDKWSEDGLSDPHSQVLVPADQVERVDSKSLRENGGLGFVTGALLLAASRRRWCSW